MCGMCGIDAGVDALRGCVWFYLTLLDLTCSYSSLEFSRSFVPSSLRYPRLRSFFVLSSFFLRSFFVLLLIFFPRSSCSAMIFTHPVPSSPKRGKGFGKEGRRAFVRVANA